MAELATFAIEHTVVFLIASFVAFHGVVESALFASRFLRWLYGEAHSLRKKIADEIAEWRRRIGGG